MTTTEAAAILGITPHTLRQQIAKGKLAARKVGRDWHVTPKEVERYRLEHRRAYALSRKENRDDHWTEKHPEENR